ncbi:MAG TPA: STAS domain-containing protein [Candidatus Polarisedimenticolia bacterium]|jgi:anti-anti-sigma factor|nr:STAS domain-containing protein [Candidatus Polarisedimenticolia bacterium]
MTLKITIQEDWDVTTLKLEGRVAGTSTTEFQRAWESLALSLGSKRLLVDLSGVTHIDADGTRVLAEIHKKTNADFRADTPMNRYFVETAKRMGRLQCKEGR